MRRIRGWPAAERRRPSGTLDGSRRSARGDAASARRPPTSRPPTRATVRSTRPTRPPRWAAITTVRSSSHGARSLAQDVLPGGVEVGGRLVEQDHGNVAEHRPADGDALALAGAEGQPALAHRGVEAVGQSPDQTVEAGLLDQRPGDARRRWRRGCRAAGCPRWCRGRGRAAAAPRRPGGATRASNGRPTLVADGDPAAARAPRSRAARRAASTCPSRTRHHGHVLAGGDVEVDAVEHRLGPAGVADGDVDEADRVAAGVGQEARAPALAVGRRRGGATAARPRPARRGCGRRPPGPRRWRGTRRRPGAAGGTPRGPAPGWPGPCPRGSVPCRRRRPRKSATSAVPTEARVSSASDDRKATLRVDIVSSRSSRLARSRVWRPSLGPPERPQGGQALEEVVEGGGQAGQPGPLPVGVPGRLQAEEDHEQRDDRHRDGQDDQGEPVGHSTMQASSDDRRQGGEDQRREVAGEVASRASTPWVADDGQLAGALAGQPRRPEGHGPGEQLAPQGRGDLGRGAVGGHLARPGSGGPHGEGARRGRDEGRSVRARPSWSIRTSGRWRRAARPGPPGTTVRRVPTATAPPGSGGWPGPGRAGGDRPARGRPVRSGSGVPPSSTVASGPGGTVPVGRRRRRHRSRRPAVSGRSPAARAGHRGDGPGPGRPSRTSPGRRAPAG